MNRAELVGATPRGSIVTRAVTRPFHLKGSTMPLCDVQGPGLTHVAHAPDDRALAMMDGRTCGHPWDHRRTVVAHQMNKWVKVNMRGECLV